MKEFDADELAKFNGENGSPMYVAYGGKVYDVSESKLWRNGQHMKRHRSGSDLTGDMQAAPHASDVLERYPQVGVIKEVAVEEPEIPAARPAYQPVSLPAAPSASDDGSLSDCLCFISAIFQYPLPDCRH
jgi:predicted heme/steroid binding protein